MNLEFFIARRIAIKSERTFSKLIVRIAIAGVMLSLAVMILAVAIIKGFKTEIQDKVRGFIGDVQIYRYDLNGSFEKSPFIPNDTTLSYLNSNTNLQSFAPFATKPCIVSANGEVEGINFKGIDKSYDWTFINKHLISGKIIDFSDPKDQILLSEYTAKRLNLKVGDRFLAHFVQNPPKRRKLTLVGIYSVGIENIDKSFAIGDLNLLRSVNNWDSNQMGGIEVRVKDFARLDTVANAIYNNLEIKFYQFPFSTNSEDLKYMPDEINHDIMHKNYLFVVD